MAVFAQTYSLTLWKENGRTVSAYAKPHPGTDGFPLRACGLTFGVTGTLHVFDQR